jgi:alanyl-tRNA synthetase
VIADHLRASAFLIADGVLPANESRGYVLRRLLRRAARFGRQQLGMDQPFIFKLVPTLVDTMGDVFPELKANPKRVMDIIADEEAGFLRIQGGGRTVKPEGNRR